MSNEASQRKLLEKIGQLESQLSTYKARQAELEASEDKYRCLLNNQNEAVFVHPFKTQGFAKFTEVNDVACKRYGYSKEEFMALTAKDITETKDAKHHARADHRRKLLDQGHLTFEAVHITKSGHRFPVEISSNITHIGDEKVILAVVRDITERKRAELALINSKNDLEASEERYQILSDLTSDYAYAYRVKSNENIVNEWVTDAFYKLTGYTKEQLIALGGWEHLLYIEDIPIAVDQLSSLLSGKSKSVEYRIVTRGGQIRWMSDYARPVWDSQQDRVTHIYGAVRDVTEQKAAAMALHESHKALMTVLDSLEATIYVADFETYEILFMNRYMREAFGKDMTGEICWSAFRGESGPCKCCTNPQLIDSQGNLTNEVVTWQDQNPITKRWYMNYDRVIRWIDNRPVRIQIATDITELKQLENERLQIEKKLRQSQKMEAIGTLAGGIAHDFNNILTAIIGYTELTTAEIDSESKAAEYLSEVLQGGIRAKDLVKQILAFARQTDEDLKPVRVSTVGKGVMKFLRSTLPTTISIHDEMNSDALVLADSTQIYQIFMNLATNAAQAMEPNGGNLTIVVKDVNLEEEDLEIPADLATDQYLKMSVFDTGKGIPEEILPLIFEPYYTDKPTGEGTGLGLSVVHGIIKKYGGDIVVSSTVGKGTEFTVLLPVISQQMIQERGQKVVIPKGQGRILFVDDDPSICDMFGQALTRLGYTPSCRTSSIEALKLFRTKPNEFNLVISDMTMPNLTGDQLASKLMKIRPDIPIILCTGYSNRISEKMALAMGIRAFLMKPLIVKDLAQTIHNILREASSGAAEHQ